eukprot:COSAG06_NODE_47471_length_339_cov_0.620833_1_plen_59_part_10
MELDNAGDQDYARAPQRHVNARRKASLGRRSRQAHSGRRVGHAQTQKSGPSGAIEMIRR